MLILLMQEFHLLKKLIETISSIHCSKKIRQQENSSIQLGSSAIPTSVTRFGDLLDFGKVFKAFGNN